MKLFLILALAVSAVWATITCEDCVVIKKQFFVMRDGKVQCQPPGRILKGYKLKANTLTDCNKDRDIIKRWTKLSAAVGPRTSVTKLGQESRVLNMLPKLEQDLPYILVKSQPSVDQPVNRIPQEPTTVQDTPTKTTEAEAVLALEFTAPTFEVFETNPVQSSQLEIRRNRLLATVGSNKPWDVLHSPNKPWSPLIKKQRNQCRELKLAKKFASLLTLEEIDWSLSNPVLKNISICTEVGVKI